MRNVCLLEAESSLTAHLWGRHTLTYGTPLEPHSDNMSLRSLPDLFAPGPFSSDVTGYNSKYLSPRSQKSLEAGIDG